MSLNSVLFWLATVSCVALVARTLPSLRQGRGAGWLFVAVAILAVGGTAEVFFPAYAGVLAGTLWAALIVLPSLLIRAVLRHALGQRYVQAERLAKLVRCLHPGDDRAYQPQAAASLRRAFVTLALVLLNLGVFAWESARGGSENLRTLLQMGALWSPAVLEHGQWYRLATALFLHFGPVHLTLNLLGLAVIGPWVERTLGHVRYAAVYLVAGVGSMAAVLGLICWGWMHEEVLVGASGAIMGLVGATGSLLALGWRRERSRLAARRLRGIVLIVLLQVAFDLMTPQVSFAAHAAGLIIGLLLTASLTVAKPTKS